MPKDPAVLTSPDEAEVRVVTTVGNRLIRDNESAAGRKVARARNYVGYCRGASERQKAHQQSTCQESGCHQTYLSFSLAHFSFSLYLKIARWRVKKCLRGQTRLQNRETSRQQNRW